ncbi:MAG TPA: hypothetical protein VFL82_07105, partial [Thermomicrobiales bacterium]|nr:hypothetical protein [Thermomicrobiales bacterium]
AGGMAAGHVIAFARRDTTDEVVIVVPRLVLGLTRGQEQMPLGREVWGDTRLTLSGVEGTRYRNLLTGEELIATANPEIGIDLADLFSVLPVALLRRSPGDEIATEMGPERA